MGDLSSADGPRRRGGHGPAQGDLLGVLWLVVVGIAFLTPALLHGSHIGTYDILSQLGLSKQPGITPHYPGNPDQIDSMIPWSALAWTQVHQGHLPLWNPYNGLGLPLAFNWQSAPLGLPALVGYLFPLQYSYDVGLLVTLVVAGTGVFVLGRVLGLGALASAFAGAVFELSGPLTGWLGFPHGAVMSWSGWLAAAAILVIRREHPARNIAFFAIVLAMTVYAGQPEVLTVVGLALVVFVIAFFVQRTPLARGTGPILRPAIDLVLASIAGLALAAPLALPGLQAISRSSRSGLAPLQAAPVHDLMYFISQGFDGLPVVGSYPFGLSLFYSETASYVGIIAVVLAVLAVSVRYDRPEVVAFAVTTVFMAGVAFVPPLHSFMDALPFIGKVSWNRALMPVALGLAILSGFGLDTLVRSHSQRRVRRWSFAWFGVAGIGLVLLFVTYRGTLPPRLADIRRSSFGGPAFGIVVGLVVTSLLTIVDRRDRKSPTRILSRAGAIAGLILLSSETAFLLTAGSPILASSSSFLRPTSAEIALQKSVGSSLVGFGNGECGVLGIDPSINDVYGVYELNAYDPIIPQKYFSSWFAVTGQHTDFAGFNEFCPVIETASVARLYGVSYVLEVKGSPGPQGASFVKNVGDEALYHVSGTSIATLTPLGPSGRLPSSQAEGTPVAVSRPAPSTMRIEATTSSRQVLRIRLTDVPGWKATIDGGPLRLFPYSGVMLQAYIPPGHHIIKLRYWPSTLTIGIVLAVLSAVGLSSAFLAESLRRRRRGVTNSIPKVSSDN